MGQPLDDETIRNANSVFVRFMEDIDAKLNRGLRLRKMYVEALARGEQPESYRLDYLDETVKLLWEWLAERCKEFDRRYPQDRFSAHDLSDVLATALGRLQEEAVKIDLNKS